MFSRDTCEMIELLHRCSVNYMIVGGYAAIYHGYVRFTADVDFFYEAEEENCKRLFRALQDFWDGSIPLVENYKELMVKGQVLQFGMPPNRLDFINEIEGVSFRECQDHLIVDTILCNQKELKANFISLNQLIKNKKAAGRPKDLIDADYLERVRKSSGQ